MKKIILASASPRRKELLSLIGVEFDVEVSDVEEVVESDVPNEVVESLSLQKAKAVAVNHKDKIVVGADTVVSINGEILGKPKDKTDCYKMIDKLQGKSHEVYTGVTMVYGKDVYTFSVCTKVNVVSMSEHEINEYISTKEPYDKAGGYGIQGIFAKYISSIEGDYYNVVGLPVQKIYEVAKSNNLI